MSSLRHTCLLPLSLYIFAFCFPLTARPPSSRSYLSPAQHRAWPPLSTLLTATGSFYQMYFGLISQYDRGRVLITLYSSQLWLFFPYCPIATEICSFLFIHDFGVALEPSTLGPFRLSCSATLSLLFLNLSVHLQYRLSLPAPACFCPRAFRSYLPPAS